MAVETRSAGTSADLVRRISDERLIEIDRYREGCCYRLLHG